MIIDTESGFIYSARVGHPTRGYQDQRNGGDDKNFAHFFVSRCAVKRIGIDNVPAAWKYGLWLYFNKIIQKRVE
ncbi:hypothetical protein IHQ71_18710 [Rhizobium sp. TH2]|uniref:hypothetical protein n=1 Tax=Rhizobium sp. TH2 TaxID=2775403 RepID=UPI0021573C17|nr:hypothetical protein [Rhizobium sp. TH2]UVC07238.1 hypothetical protein IHQ71_18710 [Rhizobium sp. TH2]